MSPSVNPWCSFLSFLISRNSIKPEIAAPTTNPVSQPLLQLYQAARRTILDNALRFDAPQLETIRTDLLDIREAMLGTATS